jgi:GNAT superfamily N-acetyltransferase
LRIVTVDRRKLASAGSSSGTNRGVPPDRVVGLLDRHGVPDWFAFVTDDDGGMRGCRFLNGYLIAALRQDAYALDNLKTTTSTTEASGKGIGTGLLRQARDWAATHGLHRLELTVMAHNHRAADLYQRMGFSIEGRRTECLLVDGQFVDELYMAALLPRAHPADPA